MSSITAPMPRAAARFPARWSVVAPPLVATVAAVALAAWAWLYGNQPIRSDALNYYEIALGIVRDGPLSFQSTLRTYGYPYFLAALIQVVGPNPEHVRTAGFVIQLLLFFVAAGVGAWRLARALGAPAWTPWLYAATVLSPFVLIHSIQMLTDVISVSLVYLAVVLSIPTGVPASGPADRAGPDAEGTSDRREHARRALRLAMLALFLGGLAVIVRPANLVLVPVLFGAWLLRTARWRDLPWRVWPVLLALFALPFVPQMLINFRAAGVPHPLLMVDLYGSNTVVGVQVAKYGTLSITGIPSRMRYDNPFKPDQPLTFWQFVAQDPLDAVATMAIHAFALFDQDLPFVYVTDVSPWYRWPLSIPNYVFLLGAAVGLVLGLGWPSGGTAPERARARFAFGLLGAATGAMVAVYLPSAVEARFSLPMYPLLAAPFVLAVARLVVAGRRRPVLLVGVAVGAALWVAGMVSASLWMDRQSPQLVAARAALASPLPPSPIATYQVELPEDWVPGQMVTIPITVTNTGPDTWNIQGFFTVTIRAQILALKTEQHRLLPKGARTYVAPPEPVAPGASASVTATVETPTAPGRYTMTVTVIRNGIDEPGPGFEKGFRVDNGR